MKLTDLHESFIKEAEKPMAFGNLPVVPKPAEAPLIAVSKWETLDGQLVKTYSFRRPDDREVFVMELFAYEKQVGHNATMTVTADKVNLRLFTHDTDMVSELDKEYARYADQVYRDVSYAPETVYGGSYGDESHPVTYDDVGRTEGQRTRVGER